MSVYKPKGSETYTYDFQWRGNRFSGTTGAKSKREAQQVERNKRAAVRRQAETQNQRKGQPMTLDEACERYWFDVGQYAKSAKQIEWSIDYLLKHLGEDKALKDINDDDVAALVARRRGERVDNIMVRKHKTKKDGKRVSHATINRSVMEPLKRIMLRARDSWGKEIGAVQWKHHRLKEPKERIRSMSADEEQRVFAELPPQYYSITRYALRTGCRAQECIDLRWSDIDWGNRRITILGKGDKLATIPLPLDIRDMLFPMQGQGGEFVFMMPARVRKDGFVEPPRRMTYRAYYSAFHRAIRRAGVVNFRIHDLRHTAATRVVAKTGNLKIAQKLLRHEDISTTAKYAAVLDDDVRNALDSMIEIKIPDKVPEEKAKSLKTKN